MARVVEPHLFWVHAGRPYLVAYCRSAGELRTFALQRVTGAQMLDEPFERRADFDAQSFVDQGFGVLHGARHAFAVRFGPAVAHLANERRWHATQAVTEHPDGSTTLAFTASGLPEVAAWVASFGGNVRAESPAELVTAVRALHAAGLAVHQENTPGPTSEADDDLPQRLTSAVNGAWQGRSRE